jgi:hypothetical protein
MEGHPEKSSFTPGLNRARDVEEGGGEEDPVFYDPDPALLLDDEEPRVARGSREEDRALESGGDLSETQLGKVRREISRSGRAVLFAPRNRNDEEQSE